MLHARSGAALLWFTIAAWAQTPPPQTAADKSPEIASHDAPSMFSSKVNLVMVPVVVRDPKGKAIGTLKKEDFQLFDKGKPQVISRFSIEKADGRVVPIKVSGEPDLDKAEKPEDLVL